MVPAFKPPAQCHAMAFYNELKRRKVFRVTSLYAVTAWGASMGAAELFPTFGLPDESVRWFVIAALGLLPVVALLAWLYELTPSGITRDPVDVERDNADAYLRTLSQDQPPELLATWQGRSSTFFQPFTIGRDIACELHIDDPKISRRHARIVAEHGNWYVEDLGSSNGTTLNGKLVSRAPLPTDAHITLYEGGDEILLHISSTGDTTTLLAGTSRRSPGPQS